MVIASLSARNIDTYPQLTGVRARGTSGARYIQFLQSGHEYTVTDDEASVLLRCTGAHSFSSLLDSSTLSSGHLRSMLSVLADAGALELPTSRQADLRSWPDSDGPYLRDIQLEVTGRCNLRCVHCYGAGYFPGTALSELRTDELLSVVDQASRMNVARCFFTGGEAFLRKDLPAIIRRCGERALFVAGIFTNGTVWREDIFEAVSDYKMETVFLVSVDGPDAETHDAIRGRNKLRRTLSFIDRCVALGYRVTVNTIVMKHNVERLVDLRNLLKLHGVSRWRVAVPREQGAAWANSESVMPDWDRVFVAYERLMQDEVREPGEMKLQLSSIFKSEFLSTKRFYLFAPDTSCCQYKQSGIVVSADGTVISCPAAYMFPQGTVRTEPLVDIWQRQSMQRLKVLPVRETRCVSCPLLPYCGGGCRVMAWEESGDLLAVDSRACPMYRFFADRVLPFYEDLGIRSEVLPRS